MDGVGAGLRLPQLPKLDQRDIESVRAFLPGKLLSRTAALLSLVLLVLGFAGAVDWTLEHQLDIHLRSMPWLRATLLGGLPLLAVAAQIAAEWQADRHCGRARTISPWVASASLPPMASWPTRRWACQQHSWDRLLTSAAALDETPGLIRPITLNVLGAVLSAGYATAPGFDAGLLIQRYIAQTIAQPALRDHAAKALEELITAYGTRRPVAETDLARVTKLRRGEVRAVMNGLAAAGLARPLDGEQAVWELAHDFIARAVARQLGRRRRDHWRHGLTYASPLLLAATVVCGRHWFGPLQLRSELAELGLTVTIEADHADAEVNSHFTEQHFAQAAPLLARLNASVPIRSFDMSDEYFDSIEPLRSLTALTTLDLSGTGIKDVAPLRGLTALMSLNLSNTQAVDLEPLKDLAGLRELNLFGTPVAKLEPLKRLTALTTLKLSNGPVANIEPLRHLAGLRELYLPGTQVADLGPLRGLTELRELSLYRTPVADLEPLWGLTALTRLDLTGTQVEDLGPLHGLTALTILGLGQTRVGDLAPLSGLTALETLSVSNDRVASLEPLKRLTGLKTLFLSGGRITDLAPLAALTALTTLDLANTRVVDLAPLSGLTSLARLNLAGTPAVDLGPLKALTALTALCLSDTRVVDLVPVQDLPKLRFINPTGAGVAPPVERRELERFATYRASRSLPAAW